MLTYTPTSGSLDYSFAFPLPCAYISTNINPSSLDCMFGAIVQTIFSPSLVKKANGISRSKLTPLSEPLGVEAAASSGVGQNARAEASEEASQANPKLLEKSILEHAVWDPELLRTPCFSGLGCWLEHSSREERVKRESKSELHKRPIDFLMTLLLGSSRYVY